MTLNPEFTYCQGCGIEVTWSPHLVNNQSFCCDDCSRGIECGCATRRELDDERPGGPSGTPSVPYV
jgi:hypothetical protein